MQKWVSSAAYSHPVPYPAQTLASGSHAFSIRDTVEKAWLREALGYANPWQCAHVKLALGYCTLFRQKHDSIEQYSFAMRL